MSRRGQGLRGAPPPAGGEAAGPAAPFPHAEGGRGTAPAPGSPDSEGGTVPLARGAQSLRGDAISALVSPESEREGRPLPPGALIWHVKSKPVP